MPMPGHDLTTGVAQHSRTQRLDHSRFLGDGDELVRPDHAPLRIAPPQQGFHAARPPARHFDLRLVDKKEFVVHQAPAHVGFELQSRLHPGIHVGGVEAVSVAAGFLGGIHRRVGLLDHRAWIGRVDGVHRHANRAGQRRCLIAQTKRRKKGFAHAGDDLHDLEGRLVRVESGKNDHELVAAETRHGIRFAHRAGQSLRDRLQ
jgi:hypothetical protein